MRNNRWLIAYVGGKRWSADDGPAAEAPKTGVVWVQNQGHAPVHGSAYFVYDAEQNWFYNCDFSGREMRLRDRPLKTVTFWGEQVPEDDWQIIKHEMKHGV